MTTTSRRTGEKGQRTPHSKDVYKERGGVKGAVYCSCGVAFHNKRWYIKESAPDQSNGHELVCPACRRISDRNPAGIVSLSGDFFAAHESEIDKLINNTAQEAFAKNPLGRVIDVSKQNNGISITTTDVKLAQKIGREVYKSFGGDLQFIWSHAEAPVRVKWSR